ncbi:MAG: radical SAM protein [Candidatus Omnitrophica bacterium]|nr:radical SAM protein [Candidatus Omnitrophota bacterium]
MKNLISDLKAVACARLYLKYPLAISWSVTKRCNCNCLYCAGNNEEEDLKTGQMLEIIDFAYAAGARYISFTGGEPLLRRDFSTIADYSHNKGIFNKLNTNGLLLSEKINEIKNIDLIHLSLDGPQDIHDSVRGRGTFQRALSGLEAARAHNKKLILSTVLSKYNLQYLEQIFELCKKYNTGVFFQPARILVYGEDKVNPAAAENEDYKKAISRIMLLKRKRIPGLKILNSIAGLKHLYHWPALTDIPCCSGLTSFKIDNKGFLYNCTGYAEPGVDVLKYGFKEAMRMLKYRACKECWCATQVEFNLAVNLNPDAIINYLVNKV